MKKVEDENKKIKSINSVYCNLVFRTKFPIFDFFYEAASVLLNLIKIERIKMYPIYEANKDYVKYCENFDLSFAIKTISRIGIEFLSKIIFPQPPCIGETLIINYMHFKLKLKLPMELNDIKFANSCRFSLVFKNVSWENILTMICIILLERNLLIVSSNKNIISTIMFS